MNDILAKVTAEKTSTEEFFKYMHAHPELSFEESGTAKYIAEKLRSWGYEVTEGIGKTGVVARMKVGEGKASIGLRADTDALPVEEAAGLEFKSTVPGVSHMCGHDAHAAMLMGAAEYLAKTKNFNGTLNLVFQPAEEIMGGAVAMLKDGLLEKFPMDRIFGMHNMPSLPLGVMHLTEGPIMAAVDNWEVVLTGKGSHGSMPEKSIDPVVAGSALVMALQTIVSRNVAPMDAAVVSVGAFLAGDAGNVIPQTATLRMSTRTRTPETRLMVLDKIRSITKAISEAYNVSYTINEGQPGAVLVNDPEQTRECVRLSQEVFGEDNVVCPGPTFMGSEDFAFFAQKLPATYVFVGNGNTPMVHHPEYVFDMSNLPRGVAYWVAIAQNFLK